VKENELAGVDDPAFSPSRPEASTDIEEAMREIRARAGALAKPPHSLPDPRFSGIEALASSANTYAVPLVFARGVFNPLVRFVAAGLRRFMTPMLMAQVQHNERVIQAFRVLSRPVQEAHEAVEELAREVERNRMQAARDLETLGAAADRDRDEVQRLLGDERRNREAFEGWARGQWEGVEHLRERVRGLEVEIGNVAERAGRVTSELHDLRQGVALQKAKLQVLLQDLRRALDGLAQPSGIPTPAGGGGPRGPNSVPAYPSREVLDRILNGSGALEDHDYYEFENRFRGTREEISNRQHIYLPIFAQRFGPEAWRDRSTQPPVLDVGCGRGEFLELLAAAGITARGIDLNEAMVESCRARGLDVTRAEALAYLRGLPDAALGGVLCCQVIEHLTTHELIELLHLCRVKLREGGVAVLETVNPLNLIVSATQFYIDLTHVRPVHPLTLQFVAECAGFATTEVRYLSPIPEELRLRSIPGEDPASLVVNETIQRLNDLLFTYQDYAVVAVA
jgi:SAM-dependent methyltransferase